MIMGKENMRTPIENSLFINIADFKSFEITRYIAWYEFKTVTKRKCSFCQTQIRNEVKVLRDVQRQIVVRPVLLRPSQHAVEGLR